MADQPQTEIGRQVWKSRYRWTQFSGVKESSVEETWRRVAAACAATEGTAQSHWQAAYLESLSEFRFLPGGRILAGAGTGAHVTLFNCFVMGDIEDSLAGICRALSESSLTMQQGGGIGLDFSTLRPRGAQARAAGRVASGPVSFMKVWAAMCDTLASTTGRGGAMMASLRCDHPDILEFVAAKRSPGALSSFNLSVQVTDDFMEAVKNDGTWQLVFPAEVLDGEGPVLVRSWPGRDAPVPCRVLHELPARVLWETIMRSVFETAEPGVLFVDTINRENNLGYRECITTTNPCGELPLPANGACDLGSINLTRFVAAPFEESATIDLPAIRETTATAVRFLDSVIDVSHYPLAEQREMALGARRVGLGITGLADTLMLLGLDYGTEPARLRAASIMETICHAAYEASVALAREKGPFPLFERESYLASPFVQRLPPPLREAIARHGVRNSHLLAIAPTGSISLLAGNVTSGIEPAFDLVYDQQMRTTADETKTFEVRSYALRLWQALQGDKPPPEWFVTARALPPSAHLAMQAALQPFVDNAISKTINLPEDFAFESTKDLYQQAYELGLKGCTIYRPHGDERSAPMSSAGIECGRCKPHGLNRIGERDHRGLH